MHSLDESLALGRELLRAGKLAEAARLYDELARRAPDHGEVRYGRGVVALRACDFPRAASELALAARAAPKLAAPQRFLGEALVALGKHSQAALALRKAIALRGPVGDAHFFLALALDGLGDRADAERALHTARNLDPALAAALHERARESRSRGALEFSRAIAEHAVRAFPDAAACWIDLGLLDLAHDDFAAADRCIARALEIDPALVDAQVAMGHLRWNEGRVAEAIEWHERALARSPDDARARFHLAIALLARGDLRAGFAAFESRKQLFAERVIRSALPEWNGGELGGKRILLYAEQGLGDTIQFARYAPLVAARGGRVVLGVPRALVALLEHASGVERAVASHEAAEELGLDVQASLVSLPHVFGHDLDSIPRAVPYLAADASRVRAWKNRLAPLAGRRVGIVWAGSAGNSNDRNRSCPLEHFAALARVPGVSLVSLQKDRSEPWPAELRALDAARELGDFADTAALVEALDLVVSVDTAACHLAGALGRPVWTLLPFCPDWRWMLGREDSPWYPSMRLFRQTTPGDWRSVVERVAAALAAQ